MHRSSPTIPADPPSLKSPARTGRFRCFVCARTCLVLHRLSVETGLGRMCRRPKRQDWAQLEVEHLRCDCIRQSGNEQAPPIFSLRYWISRSRCTYATAARRSLNNTKRTSDGIAADRGSIIRRTNRRASFASLRAESAEFVRLTVLCPGVHICDYTLSTDGDGSMP